TGISLRPVGSRRPPHEISWARLLCTVAGQGEGAGQPSAEELTAAVEAVKKGGPKPAGGAKPAAAPAEQPAEQPAPPEPEGNPRKRVAHKPAAGGGTDMASLLARLEAWLAKHRKHFLEHLRPGALPADLDSLQSHLGCPLPEDLREMLSWHNGQGEGFGGKFEGDWIYLGTDRIAAAKHDLDEGARADNSTGWQSAWVPFLDDDGGDYMCLDTGQPQAPMRAFYLGQPEHPVVAPSLRAWLEDFVTAVERGEYHEDPERGSFLRKSQAG